MKIPKLDFSRDNPYNSFGRKEFINANTGETVKMVTNDYRTLSEKGGIATHTSKSLDDEITKLIESLPEQVDLTNIEDKHFLYNEKPKELINREELRSFNFGAIEAVYIYYNESTL